MLKYIDSIICINVYKLELKCVKYSRKFSKKKSLSAIWVPFIGDDKLVCRSQTIKLSIQTVTAVTNHDQFNKGHAWMDT